MGPNDVEPMPRHRPAQDAAERDTLAGVLDFLRLEKTETLSGIVADYQSECERSREVIGSAGLDDVAQAEGMAFKLRYAMVHMIEETARHCGHLDLLRESIDGVTGE